MADVKTYPANLNIIPKAIAVYCGDPRFLTATEKFLEESGFPKKDCVPFVVGGSVSSLAEPFTRPKDAKFMREQLQFYVEHFTSVNRMILINHEDCGRYRVLSSLLPTFLTHVKNMVERQLGDLSEVSQMISEFLPRKIEIERYYARFTSPERSQIIFDKR